ncbi:MAG TPA: hypothetical protein VFZ26_16050 [Gemmatimonadales bacterium]
MTTTCFGFGPHYNEDLLEPMAGAGGGNYWYGETEDQVAGVSFPQSHPVRQTPEHGWRVLLHDLYANSPKALGLVFHVEEVRELGQVQLGEVRVEADVVTDTGIEHRTTTMPVLANLDGEDHIEPDVETTFLWFEAGRAREEAVRRADRGDFDGAAASLRSAARGLAACPPSPGLADEIEDLEAEAARLEQRRYDASDVGPGRSPSPGLAPARRAPRAPWPPGCRR